MSNLKRYTLYILNLIDIISIILAHLSAYIVRTRIIVHYVHFIEKADYMKNLLFAVVAYIIFNVAVQYSDEHFMERNRWEELHTTLKMSVIVTALPLLYYFVTKQAESFSRIYVGLFFVFLTLIDLLMRILVRQYVIPKYRISGNVEDVLIITEYESASRIIRKVNTRDDWRYMISGLIVVDRDMKGQDIEGVHVVSDRKEMFSDVAVSESDSVLIAAGDEKKSVIREWITRFRETGKIVHVEIEEYDFEESVRDLDRMGETAVVTYRVISPTPKRQVLVQRLIDIAFGLILLPLFLLFTLCVWVLTQVESSGPLLVARVRVGKHNRRFYQFAYRVYRIDAEERIAAGKSPYTIIGMILDKLHLTGMPVLLNILSGEMSFIGPQAPDLQDYLKMSVKERNILSIIPGAFGYWTCEPAKEKVLTQDQDYIENWNLMKDFRIVISTFLRYISGNALNRKSARYYDEELRFVNAVCEERKPMEYDRSMFVPELSAEKKVYHALKRLVDIVLSSAGILVLSPLLLLLSVLVIADDGGTPFYGHKRIGLNGKRIKVYKFRSMRTDAGDLEKLLTPEQLEQYRREFKIENDPRITRIGEFIRKTSLDELPQLFNILGGSLSIVGPRPIVEEETKKYGNDVAKLLSVKPGLTGYWQAYARNNATYDTGERQKMEMYYIDHQSLLLDIRIFFHTFISVLKQEGAE